MSSEVRSFDRITAEKEDVYEKEKKPRIIGTKKHDHL